MASSTYTVQRLDADSVDDAVLRVWSDNLPLEGPALAKYRWFYRENPLGHGSLFVLRHEGPGSRPIVGTAGVGSRSFEWCGSPVRGVLLADFAVDRAHRTAGPALQIQRAVYEYAATLGDFVYGFPNPAAAPVFRRLGYRDLGQMRAYVRVLRHAPRVRRFVSSDLAAAVIGGVFDAVTGGRHLVRRRADRNRGLRLHIRHEVDPRVDALGGSARSRFEMSGRRNSEFLGWRFLGKPQPAEIATLEDPSSDALLAYAVVVPAPPDGVFLPDFLAASEADLRALLYALETPLRARGVSTVRTEFLGSSAVAQTLRSCGYVRRSVRPVVVGPGRPGSPTAASLPPPERWYLTQADEDN